jgi:hypothetical protein
MRKPVTEDLVITPPPPAVKPHYRVVVAIRQLKKRVDMLDERINGLIAERDSILSSLALIDK